MKDYFRWHTAKTAIECHSAVSDFWVREVWWCSLGLNVGSEEDGKNASFERPVLIFRKFGRDMFWAIPLTSKRRDGKYYFVFSFRNKIQTLLLSQLRTLSPKRLIRCIGKISRSNFRAVTLAIRAL